MDVHREQGQYVGTLTRVSDSFSVGFWGLLEFVYALEQFEAAEAPRESTAPIESTRAA